MILSTPPTPLEIEELKQRNTQVATDEQINSKEDLLNDMRFKTHASIVMCPNHLAQQWQDQILQHSEFLKVLKFTTVSELKGKSYQDIMEAGSGP